MEGYKRLGFMSIIVVALGGVFSTTMGEQLGSLGTVFIAIGGLLLIASMNQKRIEEGQKE